VWSLRKLSLTLPPLGRWLYRLSRLHKAIKQSGTGLIVSTEHPLDVCRESEYYEFEGYFELCSL